MCDTKSLSNQHEDDCKAMKQRANGSVILIINNSYDLEFSIWLYITIHQKPVDHMIYRVLSRY